MAVASFSRNDNRDMGDSGPVPTRFPHRMYLQKSEQTPDVCSQTFSKRDRVNWLSCLIAYDQGSVSGTITAVFQFTHNAVPMIFCDFMVWQLHAIRIVARVVRFANDKMMARHVIHHHLSPYK